MKHILTLTEQYNGISLFKVKDYVKINKLGNISQLNIQFQQLAAIINKMLEFFWTSLYMVYI